MRPEISSRHRRPFEQALRINPAYAEAHYNYGRALAKVKMFDPAERELKSALKLNPKLAEADVSLGMILGRRVIGMQRSSSIAGRLRISPG